jgi:hypothetical protein
MYFFGNAASWIGSNRLQLRQNISTIWLSSIQQCKFKFNFVMCIIQSHEINWFFCNQKLNHWWLRNTRSCYQFSFIWPSSFVWDGCVEGEKRPWWACFNLFYHKEHLCPPPCRGVSTSCCVCPYSTWLWYELTMFYIIFLRLFVVPKGSGSIFLTFLVQLSVENITYHPCY